MIPPPPQAVPSDRPPPLPAWSGRMRLGLAFVLGILAVFLIQYAVERFRPGRPAEPVERVVYLVDLNHAGRNELMQLPGVGEMLADRILEYRGRQGGFRQVDDLDRVPGLGPTMIERLRPRVQVRSAGLVDTVSPLDGLPKGQIDLNRATKEELIALPAVGPVLAERILADRAKNGPFRSIEELTRVSGIKHKTLEKLRGFVSVEKDQTVAESRR